MDALDGGPQFEFAAQFPEFNRAASSKVYTVRRSLMKEDSLLINHAKFLWKFPGADGIKTGYTVPAGHCFVGGATWNGVSGDRDSRSSSTAGAAPGSFRTSGGWAAVPLETPGGVSGWVNTMYDNRLAATNRSVR